MADNYQRGCATTGGNGITTPEKFDMWTQHITSRFDANGVYTVNMRYVMDTNRSFLETPGQASIVTEYISPMTYRPHDPGDVLEVDGISVTLGGIEGRWLNDVQYELVETWTTTDPGILAGGRLGPNNLKNWSIDYSWVRSKYPVPSYSVGGAGLTPNNDEPYNTAGDIIEVPVMVVNITISGRWWQLSKPVSAWGLNGNNGVLLGISVPKHCGLFTQAALPHPIPGTEGNPRYQGYDVTLKGIISYDYMETSPKSNFLTGDRSYGGHDLLVPMMGYRELVGPEEKKVLQPILSGYEDQDLGVFPQQMSWLDAEGKKIADPAPDEEKCYKVFQLYPELPTRFILPGTHVDDPPGIPIPPVNP